MKVQRDNTRSNSLYKQTINYDFHLNKLLICCLLIVSKVVVEFFFVEVLGRIRYVEYDHAEYVLYK